MARPRVVSIALFLAALPAPVNALSVRTASVALNVRHGDRLHLAGGFTTLELTGATTVALEVDRFAFVIPTDQLVRGHGGHILRYRGPRGRAGLRRLVLDVRHRRFDAQASGVPLEGLSDPLAVRIASETASDCAMIALERRTGRRKTAPTHLRLARRADAGPCALEAPSLAPVNVAVDEPTDVQVRVRALPGVTLDPDSVRLMRTDGGGRAVGSALCRLADDGDPAHGDAVAGDGVYGCLAAFGESTPGVVPLVVEASVEGRQVTSSSVGLGVVPPFGDGDAATVAGVQAMALDVWNANVARLGDTFEARAETIRTLAAADGVAEVMLAGDGRSIEIRYVSGVSGGLMLSPRGDSDPAATAVGVGGALVARPAFLDVRPPRADTVGRATTQRARVGNANVLVFDPGFFRNSEVRGSGLVFTNEAPVIVGIMRNAACPRFNVDYLVGAAASIDRLGALPQYGTFVVSSHGFLTRSGQVGFLTGDRASQDFVAAHVRDLRITGVLATAGVPDQALADAVVVKPGFVGALGGALQNAIVYLGSCWSAANASLANAFLAKGAAAYWGYSRSVETGFAARVGPAPLRSMVLDTQNAGDAYAAAPEKIDPYDGAYFTAFDRDPSVTYLGDPMVTPDTADLHYPADADHPAQVSLTASVDGAEDCDLLYHWQNAAHAGHLVDGEPGHQDDFEGTSDTVTYTAIDASDTDTVTVEVFARDGRGGRQSLKTATASIQVTSTLYTISGQDGGSFVVDDGLDVYLNGMLISSDGGAQSGYRSPIAFQGKQGDTLRFVVNDTYGGCSSLSALYLTHAGHTVLADGGFSLGCPPTPAGYVTHDQTFVIPF